jgi:hypothetical protein
LSDPSFRSPRWLNCAGVLQRAAEHPTADRVGQRGDRTAGGGPPQFAGDGLAGDVVG